MARGKREGTTHCFGPAMTTGNMRQSAGKRAPSALIAPPQVHRPDHAARVHLLIAAWFKTVLAALEIGQDPLDKEIEEARAAYKVAMDRDQSSDATGPK